MLIVELSLAFVTDTFLFLWLTQNQVSFDSPHGGTFRQGVSAMPLYFSLAFLIPILIGIFSISFNVMRIRQESQQFYATAVLFPAPVTGKHIDRGVKYTLYILEYVFSDPSDDAKECSGNESVSREFYESVELGDQVEVLYSLRPPHQFFLAREESPFEPSLNLCALTLAFLVVGLILSGIYVRQGMRLKNEGRLVAIPILSMRRDIQRGERHLLFDRLEPTGNPFWFLVSKSTYARFRIGERVVFRYVPGAPHIFRPMWQRPVESVLKREA